MKRTLLVALLLCAVAGAAFILTRMQDQPDSLKVAISPYQDIGMIQNIQPLGLDKKYGLAPEMVTLAWEEIIPAMASAGSTFDLGYASYIEWLTKYQNLNKGSSNKLVFIYPAYVFKGGGFISFDDSIPELGTEEIKDKGKARAFLSNRIGAQKNSMFDMMLFGLARNSDFPLADLKIVDTSMDNSLLAARNGDLPIASAGLTQLTEAKRTGGRLILSMDTINFADITGFITTEEKLKDRGQEIEKFIRMWFDCVDYVLADPKANSKHTRAYLDRTAATKYNADEYAEAISNEFFPRSIGEMQRTILSKDGKFSLYKIHETASAFLLQNKISVEAPPLPPILQIAP